MLDNIISSFSVPRMCEAWMNQPARRKFRAHVCDPDPRKAVVFGSVKKGKTSTQRG